ncbi:HEPN domain-containing protein [Thermodesulfobacteriota bacterium]
MNASAEEWLEFANVDLMAAERLLEDPNLTNVVCFHAQQCLEKSLKALIESTGAIPPKTHDLVRLYGLIEEKIDMEEDILALLNEVYIESRYPASYGLLPAGRPDTSDAEKFLSFAKETHSKITKLVIF